MLDYENSLNPREERREWAELLSGLCIHRITPAARILALARALIKSVKIKPRDALHVACAETERCDYFVTCDDDLVRIVRTRRRAPKLRVIAVTVILWSLLGGKVGRVVKVKSDRDLVDSGIKALVDALGYSGAARFLRHFSKGEGDYLVIQEKLFKGMDLEQIYKKAKEHHRAK